MRSTIRVRPYRALHRTTPAVLAIFAATACDKGQTSTTPPPEPVVAETAPEAPQPDDVETNEPPPEAPASDTEPSSEGQPPESATAESTGTWVDTNAPVPVPEDPAEGLSEPTSFANVKLELRTPNGKVMRDKGKVIAWQQPTKIPFDFQGGKHEFVVDITRDGKRATVELTYELDGVEVLRAYELETKIGKREVIRIEDGTGLAVTVTPKTIKPKTRPQREKIEKRESKDPLSGAKR